MYFPSNITLRVSAYVFHHNENRDVQSDVQSDIDKQPEKRVTPLGEIKKVFINNVIFNLTFEGSSPGRGGVRVEKLEVLFQARGKYE